jgi:hypothetical protein
MLLRNSWTGPATAAAIGVSILMAGTTPVAAKTCKDPITTKSRSTAKVSDKRREARAKDGAIAHWRVMARKSYGFAYRFWSRAEDRSVACGGGASGRHCTVTARPCRLI